MQWLVLHLWNREAGHTVTNFEAPLWDAEQAAFKHFASVKEDHPDTVGRIDTYTSSEMGVDIAYGETIKQ